MLLRCVDKSLYDISNCKLFVYLRLMTTAVMNCYCVARDDMQASRESAKMNTTSAYVCSFVCICNRPMSSLLWWISTYRELYHSWAVRRVSCSIILSFSAVLLYTACYFICPWITMTFYGMLRHRSPIGRASVYLRSFFPRRSISAIWQLTWWRRHQKNRCYADFVKESRRIFSGQKTNFRRFFSAMHAQMAAPLPNAKGRPLIENLKQSYIMGMFGLCSGELWWGSDTGKPFSRKNTLPKFRQCRERNECHTLLGGVTNSEIESLTDYDCGRF